MALDTVVTREELAEKLGAKVGQAEVQDILDAAVDILALRLADAFRPVPESVQRLLVIAVCRALWEQRKPMHGGAQLTTVGGEVGVRPARDPLFTSYPILSQYVVIGL